MKFKVTLTPDEDGWFVAEVPELPGCLSQGESREAALANIRDAIQGWIKVRLMREQTGNGDSVESLNGSDTVEVEV